jgi:hypothetical protein
MMLSRHNYSRNKWDLIKRSLNMLQAICKTYVSGNMFLCSLGRGKVLRMLEIY